MYSRPRLSLHSDVLKILTTLLVRTKLRTTAPSNQPSGSFRCGNKRYCTCIYISDGQTDYTFHTTGDTSTINHRIECNSRKVLYMVECRRCNKQYIGETKRQLTKRFNEHRRPVHKQVLFNNSKLMAVSEHFFHLIIILPLTCNLSCLS